MTADEIMYEIRTQRHEIMRKQYGKKPMTVYIDTETLETLWNHNDFYFHNRHVKSSEWTVFGMKIYEVISESPHIRVVQ